MTTQHTSGPWTVDKATGNITGIVDGATKPIVCTMPVWWAGQQPGRHVSQDLQEANAQLIAQAPNLLANLMAACNVIELLLPLIQVSSDRWSEFGLTDKGRAEVLAHIADYKAAIARAKGQ